MLGIRSSGPARVTPRVLALRVLVLLATLLGLAAPPAQAASTAAPFKVLALYSGTWDAAHISFVREANQWFPARAAENGFTFHVSAFTTAAQNWPWYHQQFLGSGNFKSNTWGPTTAVLRTEDRTHASTRNLPATFTSSVSEWYSWSNDLRRNPDIKILASVDASSFPLGTDPNQTWYSGYYPILWTNAKYRMLYANFGHNAMDYASNTPLSSTFASATQNRFLLDGLKWLGTT